MDDEQQRAARLADPDGAPPVSLAYLRSHVPLPAALPPAARGAAPEVSRADAARWAAGCPGIVRRGGTRGSGGDAAPPRVLILRRRSSRIITNHEELEAALVASGANVTVIDDAAKPRPSFWQVAALFASAHVVVAAHGAGLTNMVAAAPGTHVVELLTDGWDWEPPMFSHFSMALGFHHHLWLVPGGGQYAPSLTAPLQRVLPVVCAALAARVGGEGE